MRVASWFTSLACSAVLLACRSGAGSSERAPSEAAPAGEVRAAAPQPTVGEAASSQPTLGEAATPTPDHAERIADLDMLCAALERDYVDGTLSDYYAKLEPRSAWGRERLREGEESITPGTLLQAAARSIAADLDSPGLANCRKLFDVLDELE